MRKLFTAFTMIMLVSFSSFAHEGHDHGTGQVQPTKGGVIQKAGDLYLEVVGSKSDLKIYPLKQTGKESKTLTPVSLNDVKLAATYSLPRGKATPVTLTKSSDHFLGKISAGSSHRYEVKLKIESGAMKDEITYQIEPQE